MISDRLREAFDREVIQIAQQNSLKIFKRQPTREIFDYLTKVFFLLDDQALYNPAYLEQIRYLLNHFPSDKHSQETLNALSVLGNIFQNTKVVRSLLCNSRGRSPYIPKKKHKLTAKKKPKLKTKPKPKQAKMKVPDAERLIELLEDPKAQNVVFAEARARPTLSRMVVDDNAQVSTGISLNSHETKMVNQISREVHLLINEEDTNITAKPTGPFDFNISAKKPLSPKPKRKIGFDSVKTLLEDLVDEVSLSGIGLALINIHASSQDCDINKDIAETALAVCIKHGLYEPITTQTRRSPSARGPR